MPTPNYGQIAQQGQAPWSLAQAQDVNQRGTVSTSGRRTGSQGGWDWSNFDPSDPSTSPWGGLNRSAFFANTPQGQQLMNGGGYSGVSQQGYNFQTRRYGGAPPTPAAGTGSSQPSGNLQTGSPGSSFGIGMGLGGGQGGGPPAGGANPLLSLMGMGGAGAASLSGGGGGGGGSGPALNMYSNTTVGYDPSQTQNHQHNILATTDWNPQQNELSIPTGPIFEPGPNYHGAYNTPEGYGNTTNNLARMRENIPTNAGKATFNMPGFNLNKKHMAGMNKNVNQLGNQQYLQHRLSVLRSPVMNEAPHLQLTAQTGAAEQLRDLEGLSNLYLQNAFSSQNTNFTNLLNSLRFLM